MERVTSGKVTDRSYYLLGGMHMSDESKMNIVLMIAELPECINNAIMNLTDKPTKSIDGIVSDIGC
jgi:hypothetical protein